MLKDYPELIQELQDTLNSYAKKPNRVQPFDGAIWILEDTLSSFIAEAREELKAAEASGDGEAITQALAKISLMRMSRTRGMHNLDDLCSYFDANKEAFA